MAKTKAKTGNLFRSNCEQTIEIAAEIGEIINEYPEHLQALKNCPFWNFYRPFHEGRVNQEDMRRTQKGIEHILNTFDPVGNVFEIQGKKFQSTAEQLAVIFGLQRIKGMEEFSLPYPTLEIHVAQTNFWKTYLKGEKKLKKKDILVSLYATAEDVTKPDVFVKLLVLYFCVAVFFPNTSGSELPAKYVKYVFAMDQVSWPDLIHSYLLEALREAKKPYIALRGCTVYILFWFAEVTHFIGKYEGEQGKIEPRFARWNIRVLTEKITKQGMTSLNPDLSGSFIDLLDEGEQSLITPIEVHQVNPDRNVKKMVRNIARYEDLELSPGADAARYLEDLAPVSLSIKRKASMEESRPCEGKRPEHMPSSEPMMPAIPNLLTQECRNTSAEDFHGYSSYSEAHTGEVESLEARDIFEGSVDATPNTSSSKCSVDFSTSLTGSASSFVQDIAEGFGFADNLQIPEEYEVLYKKINAKYGHIATREIIKCNDDILHFVNNLLKIISAMETVRGEELSVELLKRWEGKIQDAEALKFNINWLREGLDDLRMIGCLHLRWTEKLKAMSKNWMQYRCNMLASVQELKNFRLNFQRQTFRNGRLKRRFQPSEKLFKKS